MIEVMSVILILTNIQPIKILCKVLPKHEEDAIIKLVLVISYLLLSLFVNLAPKRFVLLASLASPLLVSPRIS